MNLYLKNISLLFCIILVIAMSDCTKDKAKGPDFRDSIVGNYNCIEHFVMGRTARGPDPGYTYDSIIGPSIITVSKLSSNNSSLVILDSPFMLLSADSIEYQYVSGHFGPQTYIVKANDSLWFANNFSGGGILCSYYYYTGRKQ